MTSFGRIFRIIQLHIGPEFCWAHPTISLKCRFGSPYKPPCAPTPPKTNMTGWKIHHEWRCISYWKWGFSNVKLVFWGVSINFPHEFFIWKFLASEGVLPRRSSQAWRMSGRCGKPSLSRQKHTPWNKNKSKFIPKQLMLGSCFLLFVVFSFLGWVASFQLRSVRFREGESLKRWKELKPKLSWV